MRKLTIVVIPDGVSSTKQWRVPRLAVRLTILFLVVASSALGFFLFDYLQLRSLRATYTMLNKENQGLKGEARILVHNLDEVKRALRRVQDYTSKLGELTRLKVQKFSKETGIGPLSAEEFHKSQAASGAKVDGKLSDYVPLGLNMDNLVFRPVFDQLNRINDDANQHALELQQLLSTLSQQKSLLSSVPAVNPVEGWMTSGFGARVSPFTGKRTMHQGVDVAAPVGTPIYAPADGVTIFSGAKSGFGNFIMIAHGYGVVTRYGHNAQNLVQPGQKITRGDQVATVGTSGRTTGPHLHYEVWVNGKVENPRKFMLDMDPDDSPASDEVYEDLPPDETYDVDAP